MTSCARGPGRRLVWWAALIRGSPGSWAANFCVEAYSWFYIDRIATILWQLSHRWRRGAANAVQRCQNENGRAGSRRGPTPSIRGAGSWRRGISTPPAASLRSESRRERRSRARPDPTPTPSPPNSRLISLLNVPEARLRGVGLHARAQDVVQRADRRLGIFLAVLERHASIEQPVVPGQVPQKRPQR